MLAMNRKFQRSLRRFSMPSKAAVAGDFGDRSVAGGSEAFVELLQQVR